MIADLIRKNRSCRRFYQKQTIAMEFLEELVNLGRLSASGGNLQPLKYIISCEPDKNAEIYDCLAWAAYLKDWPGPREGERPSAYIVILADTQISKDVGCDHGIAAQNILLGAREEGLAGCMIGSIRRQRLREVLAVDPQFTILLVIALGKPKEDITIDSIGPGESIKYWRDANGVHHVPKRGLSEVIIGSYDAPAKER